eukprot:scaffold25117_cov117-Cylindrotheca_fusiformis.AAC.2
MELLVYFKYNLRLRRNCIMHFKFATEWVFLKENESLQHPTYNSPTLIRLPWQRIEAKKDRYNKRDPGPSFTVVQRNNMAVSSISSVESG